MPWAGALRRELSVRGQQIAVASGSLHELTAAETPSVIFGRSENHRHGNFYPASFRNICANPRMGAQACEGPYRLAQGIAPRGLAMEGAGLREQFGRAAHECFLLPAHESANRALCSMLGVPSGLMPQFGFRPEIPLRNGKTDRTEIDMKLGDLMVEAKLTETDFQTAPARMIERYRDLDEVFDPEELMMSGDVVPNYQLIRGVLAASATGGSFCVLCDARRPDLIENWYSVMRAVRSCVLRCRLQLLTWQELTVVLSKSLQKFLAAKYGITA